MAATVMINGQEYVERFQLFPYQITMNVALGTFLNQRLNFPGLAPFWLKSLTRVSISTAGATVDRRFKWKFGNTDGGIWYMQSGLGGTNDRVVDSLIFGTAQFPKVLTPYILYQPNASIPMEFEDLSNTADYIIHLCFEGSLLFKAN